MELIDFSAEAQPEKNRVVLDWATASELNNSHFTVERSVDGSSFTPVMEVASQGSGNVTRSYQVFDSEPIDGKSFYRLKQTDLDGSFTYYNQVEVTFKSSPRAMIKLFPSPVAAGGNVTAEFRVPGARTVILTVQLVSGQEVQHRTITDVAGGRVEVNTESLRPGIYIVRVFSSETPGMSAASRLVVTP